MAESCPKKRPAENARPRTGNIFSQIHHRELSAGLGVKFRSVPSRFQIPLRSVLIDDAQSGVFLCFSRDGSQLISYVLSSSDNSAYKMQFWESPLWSKERHGEKLQKIGEIPLFTGCNVQDDGEIGNNALEIEEKHLQINVVESVCGCFVVVGNRPLEGTDDQPRQVFVTIIPPLTGRVTSLHFTYVCYGPVTKPIVLPSKDPSDGVQSSFLLIVNTVDAFRALKVRCTRSLDCRAPSTNDGATSRFFQTHNWLDLTTEHVLINANEAVVNLVVDATVSLELEPVLACWLSRQTGPRCLLRDYSAVCVPGPAVPGDLLAVAVLHSTPSVEHESKEVFTVLAITMGMEAHRLSISQLTWSKPTLQQVACSMASSVKTRASNLHELCVAGASLLARQRYPPISKFDRVHCADNGPVFNHRSRQFLLNPCFPIAIVL